MEKISARTGWLWLVQGFALFRQQPGSLAALFFVYLFLITCTSVIPLIGQAVSVVAVPAFSVAFGRACVKIEAQQRVMPILLGSAFQKPVVAPLIFLGVLYLLAALLVREASDLVDGGLLWKIASGQIKAPEKLPDDAHVGTALLLSIALYIPVAMAFCFSAVLIYWQRMSVGKALFYSFFAVARSFSAFIVLIAAWFGVMMASTIFIVQLFGTGSMAVLFLAPIMIFMILIMQCSVYAAYRQIFGKPTDDAADLQGPSTR